MKSKTIMVSVIALFLAMAFALTTVTATDFVRIDDVSIDDVSFEERRNIVGHPSEVIEIEVQFTALEDASDVWIKVYIEDYKSETLEKVSLRSPLYENDVVIERFNLKLPSTFDFDETREALTLLVRVGADGESAVEKEYTISLTKDSYSLNFLSIDSPNQAVAGDVIPVEVVVENNGDTRLDNVYVKVSIPELGIQTRAYLGDIASVVDSDDDDINDATFKRIFLELPRNTPAGTYDLEIEAFNYDAAIKAKKIIVIEDTKSSILPTITSKTIAAGEETIFSFVITNPSDRMVLYSITPTESTGLIVEVVTPIVTVGADSSTTVQVKVKATTGVEEGTHLITLNVNSESGSTRQVSFTANVEGKAGPATDTVFVLTVVLAIIFIVLLVILIVLLTKKPTETEELGETSYY